MAFVALSACGRVGFAPSTSDALPQLADTPADTPSVAISYVQRTETSDSVTSSTVTTPPFARGTTAGNAIICAFDTSGVAPVVTSITDTAGNPYVRGAGPFVNSAAWTDEVWYAVGITAAVALVVSATFNAPSSRKNLTCHEYAGIRAAAALDTVATMTFVGGGTQVLGPVVTDTAPELAFSMFSTAGTLSPGVGFTTRSTIDDDLYQDQIVTASGSQTATASCSTDCQGIVLWFRGQ